MALKRNVESARKSWHLLTVYGKFEQIVVLILTVIIAVVVIAAVWNLAVKVVAALILAGSFDPTDHAVFQAVFGMIFTVIIALEFKRSLLVIAERHESIVQVQTVVLLAMLAILRKLIILDLAATEAVKLLGLGAAIIALGGVYWLVRDQDRKEEVAREKD
jgi:uncharacterized membrane protein (DUF373 family)